MIDFPATRAALAEIVSDSVGDLATVYPSGINSLVSYPAVVIGMPRWEPNVQPCMDRVTWPISVVVARSGTADTAVIDQLEDLWPIVVQGLDDRITQDQTLAGVCKAAQLVRADPGFLTVQGSDLPAQTITIELYG